MPEKVIRIGDNKGARPTFWMMAPALRPVTEIFYDHGDHIWGGPGQRRRRRRPLYRNLEQRFMQFNRDENGV